MNSFADTPLFFFMDNISPIIPKIPKDVRKIIELSDRGCDARLPISKLLRGTGYSQNFPKAQQNEVRKPYFDEKAENKFYAEQCQAQNDRNLMNPGKYYFIPMNDEVNQEDCWQKYFPYDDSTDSEEFRRKSKAKDFRTKLRATSEKARSNFSRPDDNAYEISSNPVRNNPDITRHTIANEINALRKENLPESYLLGGKTGGYRSKFPRSAHPKLDPKFTEQAVMNEKMIGTNQDYREDCQFKETQRNSARSHKYHCQKFNIPTYNETENLANEVSPKFHKFSKCNSKNQRPVSGSARSNDVSRDWEETTASRIRSRTCSPPVDRRKNPRSFPKTSEKMDQSNNQSNPVTVHDIECSSSDMNSQFSQEKNEKSNHSMRIPKRFIDRAVDRDSLSDVQNVYTITEQLSRPTMPSDVSSNQTGTFSYWEFIPLDDDNDQKCKKVSEKRKISYPYQQQISANINPLPKRLPRHLNDSPKAKKPPVHKDAKNQESFEFLANDSSNFESFDISSFVNPEDLSETINSTRNCLLHSFRDQPNKPQTDFEEAKSKPNLERKRMESSNNYRSPKMIGTKNQVQSKLESKSQSRIGNTFNFGWTYRESQCSKRPYSAKSEYDDNKNKIPDINDDSNFDDYHKFKTNIVERTTACLKRKLDKSKLRDISTNSNQRSPVVIEKKIRSEDPVYSSRLPIRIGSRVRSRNPFASYRTNCKDENKGARMKELSENSRRLSSVRSRTKPKMRPSVILNETMDHSGTCRNDQPMQISQSSAEDENRVEENLKEKSPLIEVIDGDTSSELVATKESSSMLKFLGNEKLEVKVEEGGTKESKVTDAKNDRRKRNTTNRSCTRETNQKIGSNRDVDYGITRNGVTEKCCFHLKNGESYRDKEHKHVSSFRSRKSTIKSQF